jgi:large subunit ribosomal protein L24
MSKMKLRNVENRIPTSLKVGDRVMVIAGGNASKKPLKGKVGTILKFVGDRNERVLVDGINNNYIKHIKAKSMGEQSRKESKIASIHVSNLMYYSDKYSKPFRLKVKFLNDGKKVRGIVLKDTKEFEEISK